MVPSERQRGTLEQRKKALGYHFLIRQIGDDQGFAQDGMHSLRGGHVWSRGVETYVIRMAATYSFRVPPSL